jgi:hypothetical protein
MNLPVEKALFILHLLCGGNGIRSIQRLTGCHQGTILRLLVKSCAGCEQLLSEASRTSR